jgi:hypothetical protein
MKIIEKIKPNNVAHTKYQDEVKSETGCSTESNEMQSKRFESELPSISKLRGEESNMALCYFANKDT